MSPPNSSATFEGREIRVGTLVKHIRPIDHRTFDPGISEVDYVLTLGKLAPPKRWDSFPKARFAPDSPLEGSGFEPSVPLPRLSSIRAGRAEIIGRSTDVFRRDREFDVSALRGRLSTSSQSQCSTDPSLIAGTWHRPLFLTRASLSHRCLRWQQAQTPGVRREFEPGRDQGTGRAGQESARL